MTGGLSVSDLAPPFRIGAARNAALRALREPVRRELEAAHDLIAEVVRADFAPIQEVVDHLLSARGKLLRPTLLLLASALHGRVPEGAVRLAAVVELLHMATLVHDDAVDHSVKRRGLPTVNARWSHQVAIIAGDYLYSRAVIETTRLEDVEAVRLLGEAANAMTIGEMRQLVSHDALDFSEEDYDRLCRSKTASLMSVAAELGARLGAPEHRRALRSYGEELGMAFQITDDLLDYTMPASVTGKPRGQDLREHKVTLPLIHALPRLTEAERGAVTAFFRDPEPDPEDVERIIELVEAHGGVDAARERAEEHGRRARELLADAPTGPARRRLEAVVDYVAERRS